MSITVPAHAALRFRSGRQFRHLFRRQRDHNSSACGYSGSLRWLTWQLTQSAWLGIVAFADFFPVLLIGPIAGRRPSLGPAARSVQ
jgi:hypothetical protein